MQGQLFSQDFLLRGVRETPAWQALTDEAVASFRARLHAVFSGRDADSALNEAQTEAELISPVLGALGWDDSTLPQVNLSAKRREDVPDWLLFANRRPNSRRSPCRKTSSACATASPCWRPSAGCGRSTGATPPSRKTPTRPRRKCCAI